MIRLLSKLFDRSRSIPEDWNTVFQIEGTLVSLEQVPTTITYRNYARPGKRCFWNRRSGFMTAAVITSRRFAVFRNGAKLLNLHFDSDYCDAVVVTLRDENTLRIVANVTAFPNKHSGEMEIWLHTSSARELYNALAKQCRTLCPEASSDPLSRVTLESNFQ